MEQQQALLAQIAMYMTALPCPPLPIYVRVRSKKEEREQARSSHDVLAAMIIAAMRRGNQALNDLRKQRQIKLTEEFITSLEALYQATENNLQQQQGMLLISPFKFFF